MIEIHLHRLQDRWFVQRNTNDFEIVLKFLLLQMATCIFHIKNSE